ncbi:unnamed protein product [Urochloa humidicola]
MREGSAVSALIEHRLCRSVRGEEHLRRLARREEQGIQQPRSGASSGLPQPARLRRGEQQAQAARCGRGGVSPGLRQPTQRGDLRAPAVGAGISRPNPPLPMG